MAFGFLQIPSLAQFLLFTQVLENLHTSLVCQVLEGVFTPLFNLPHLPCIPTAAWCVLFSVMVRKHNAVGQSLDLYAAL